jgi:hypothetical protein
MAAKALLLPVRPLCGFNQPCSPLPRWPRLATALYTAWTSHTLSCSTTGWSGRLKRRAAGAASHARQQRASWGGQPRTRSHTRQRACSCMMACMVAGFCGNRMLMSQRYAPLLTPPHRPAVGPHQAATLAPLHNPPGLAGISAAQKVFGSAVPNVRAAGAARDASQLAVMLPDSAFNLPRTPGWIPDHRMLTAGHPQVAVFDTAFHQTLPPHAFIYALPLE